MTDTKPAPDDVMSLLTNPDDPSSRRWLLGATAATAALMGFGAAWLRMSQEDAPAGVAPMDGFWSQRWDSPNGTPVAMESFRGRPLLLNFWATWCTPCVEELPMINEFFQQNRSNGWQVLGLAVDKLAAVQSFLKKMPLEFPVAMAGLSGSELSRGLGNVAGGLPFSVVLGSDGLVAHRKLGRLQPADLRTWLRLK